MDLSIFDYSVDRANVASPSGLANGLCIAQSLLGRPAKSVGTWYVIGSFNTGLRSTFGFLACLASFFSSCLSGVAGTKVVSGDFSSPSFPFHHWTPVSICFSCLCQRSRRNLALQYSKLDLLVSGEQSFSPVLLFVSRPPVSRERGENDEQSFSPGYVQLCP
jgi:hypothetical protein